MAGTRAIKAHWPRPLSLFILPLRWNNATSNNNSSSPAKKCCSSFLIVFISSYVCVGKQLFDPTVYTDTRSCRFDLYICGTFRLGKKVTFDWSVWTIRIKSLLFLSLFIGANRIWIATQSRSKIRLPLSWLDPTDREMNLDATSI
jgi:hypothetical protein